MYELAVRRDFVAHHFLIGGDWGAENFRHAHHYTLELQLSADMLDQHGYLVDIVAVEASLDAFVASVRDQTLNDLAPFSGLNPSIEHFCRIACQALVAAIRAPNIRCYRVQIWENEIAWAAYTHTR